MMKQLSPEQIQKLREPLPAEAVKPHPTKTFLSSIKAIYVVERLNNVFGIGAWHLKSEIIDNTTAMIVVKSILTIPEYSIELESYGGNDNGGENSKNHDLGDAYKGAVTDAFTKICSYLEIGIDVFKGKADKGAAKQPEAPKQPHKDWLNPNTNQWNAAIDYLNSGGNIESIEKKYRLSSANREMLLSETIEAAPTK